MNLKIRKLKGAIRKRMALFFICFVLTPAATVLGGCAHEPESPADKIEFEKVQGVIRDHLNDIRACYVDALKKDSSLQGVLELKWKIGLDGHVIGAGVKSSTLNNSELGECGVGKLMAWVFPDLGAKEIVTVTYPFLLRTRE